MSNVTNVGEFKANKNNIEKEISGKGYDDVRVSASKVGIVLYSTDNLDPVVLASAISFSEIESVPVHKRFYWEQMIQYWQLVVSPDTPFDDYLQQTFTEDLVATLQNVSAWPDIKRFVLDRGSKIAHIIIEFDREKIEAPSRLFLHYANDVILSEQEISAIKTKSKSVV